MKLLLLFMVLLVLMFYGIAASATVIEIQNPHVSKEVLLLTDSREPEKEVREVTAYSELDSCHYPKGSKCLTASGKIAEVGMVACPRNLALGTKVELLGGIYTCEDRLVKRYDNRIDVFMGYNQEGYDNAKKFGKQKLEIEIIE